MSDPLRIEEQMFRSYGTEAEWLAYCERTGIDPSPAFHEPEPEPEPTTGFGRMRAAIRRARGGDAPVNPRGFA